MCHVYIHISDTTATDLCIFGQKTRALTPSIHPDQINDVRFQTRNAPATNQPQNRISLNTSSNMLSSYENRKFSYNPSIVKEIYNSNPS